MFLNCVVGFDTLIFVNADTNVTRSGSKSIKSSVEHSNYWKKPSKSDLPDATSSGSSLQPPPLKKGSEEPN